MNSILKLRLLFIFPLFLLFYFSSAQNWLPVRTGLQSNFNCDTSRILFSIKIDSVKFNNGDSIYYLNRVVRICDTCSSSFINDQLPIAQNYAYEGLSSDFF